MKPDPWPGRAWLATVDSDGDALLKLAARIERHPDLYRHEPVPVKRAAWRVMGTLYDPSPADDAAWRRRLSAELRSLRRAVRAAELRAGRRLRRVAPPRDGDGERAAP